MNKKTWHKKTLGLLNKSKTPLSKIAKATGLGVRWLQRFRNSEMSAPDVNKVNVLHDYLEK